MATAPIEHQGDADEAAPMVKLTFLVPAEWRDAIAAAAKVQRISMADLCRIIMRGFLRDRYSAEQQSRLGIS